MSTEIYRVAEFNRQTIEDLFRDKKDTEFLSVWSPSEITLLAQISPLTVRRINEQTQANYPIIEQNLVEQAKALAAFLTLSIDNSVFKGILRPDMVRSKVRNLTNLYDALGEHCPMHPEDVTDANFLDYAFMTKQLVLDVARRFRRDFEQTQRLE